MMAFNRGGFLPIVAILLLLSPQPEITNAQQPLFDCDGPATGCTNGLWSPTNCKCECISPFCHDGNGECNVPGGCSNSANPWRDCQVEINDCPWWKSLVDAERCESGPNVPPGVWNIYDSEMVCCDVHYTHSTKCTFLIPEAPQPQPEEVSSPPAPTKYPTPDASNAEENEYELVPIQFSVSGLPNVVNTRELKAEMLIVLKRIIIDLAERVSDLKVTNVEENLVLTVPSVEPQNRRRTIEEDNSRDPNNKRHVYYDITVVRHPTKKFGPIIIAGLRDSYDVIIQEIEDYTNMKYFGYGVDLTWCTDDGGEVFDMCTRNEERVLLNFKLRNLPSELDLNELILQFIQIYKDILEEGGSIDKLDIVDIEQNKVVEILQSEDEGEKNVNVFLDIIVERKFDVIDFGPAINETISTSKNEVLERIQSYTDTSTDLDLTWCINSDNVAYAICPQVEESQRRFALPDWAIITLTVVSVVLAFCICWCITAYIRQRDEEKNERNMMTYLHAGQNYHKGPPRNSRQYSDRGRRQQPPEPPPHRHRQTRTQKRRRHRDDDRRPTRPHQSHHHNHRQSREPRPIKQQHGPTPKQKYRRTSQSTGVSEEQIWEDEDQPQRLMITNDTNYQMENMPSFVFDINDGNKNDANGGGLPPPRPLMLLNGEQHPDPDGFMVEDGNWFVDEESVLPPPNRR